MATAAAASTKVAPTPDTDTTTQSAASAKGKPEAKVHQGLETLIKSYDTACEKAESYYIQIIEEIQKNKISRADVVATLMRARGITFETAQSQYSRMKGIWQNEEVLKQLKAGEISLRMAREKTTNKQAKNPNSAGTTGSATGGNGGTKDTETKEARYDRCRKALVASAKECGFDIKSVLLSLEADLKAAGLK